MWKCRLKRSGCCDGGKEGDGCGEVLRIDFDDAAVLHYYIVSRLLLLCFYEVLRVLQVGKMTACSVLFRACGTMGRKGLHCHRPAIR
jgi:hypothetical protein